LGKHQMAKEKRVACRTIKYGRIALQERSSPRLVELTGVVVRQAVQTWGEYIITLVTSH